MLTTTLFLIASGILIGAGMVVIWRDVQKNRRKAFVVQRTEPDGPEANSEAEITISKRHAPVQSGGSGLSTLAPELLQPFSDRMAPLPTSTAQPADDARLGHTRDDPGHLHVERQWAALQPTIAAGADRINAMLAPARLSLGAPGEPSWSYKNKGFGAYRRLILGEESIAWLRMELSADGVLGATTRAHKDARAALNAAATTPAEHLTETGVSDLLSACLKAAVVHATEPLGLDYSTPTPAGNGWLEVDAIVTAAIAAANGAFAQTGARLLPLTPPAWDADLRRHRLTLAVEVDAADVARMLIERLPHEMEVAVGVRDADMIGLGRRRRIPTSGMTTHALAELIASCAWPAIARFKDARRPA